MNFLNSFVLFGIGAISIPLLIHFLARHRRKIVQFPSIRLLERMRTESIRMLRIKQLIILLLRMLIIAMIVLAFARPVFMSALRGDARTAAVIVIDSSASMTYVDNGERLSARSMRHAQDILGMLGDGDMAAVIFAGKKPALLDSGLTTDIRKLMKSLENTANTYGVADTDEALSMAMDLLTSSGTVNREIYFLTDGLTTPEPGQIHIPEGSVRIYEVLLGPDRHTGAVIEDIRLLDRVLAPGGAMTIEADVLFGEDRHEADVAVFVNGERKGKTTIVAEPGQRSTASFTLAVDDPGWYSVSVEVDGGVFEPGESRYLAVHVPDPPRILLVTGSVNDGYYLGRALGLHSENPYFQVKSVSADLLAPSDLPSTDVIVLAGVERINDAVYRSLVSQVIEHGAGIMIFPPESAVESPLYSDGLFRDILPARVERLVVSGENGTVSIDRFNVNHPILRGVIPDKEDFQQPTAATYLVLSPSTDAAVLAWFTDDSPAACTIDCGKGRAVVWTVDASGESNELPLTGVFVPLMINAMYYLSDQEIVGPEFVTDTDRIMLAQKIPSGERLRVQPPDGLAKLVDAEETATGTRIDGFSTDVSGVYSLLTGENELARFTVNVAPEEVVMSRQDHGNPISAQENVSWRKIRDTGSIRDVILKDRYGMELAGMFMCFGLFLLLLEMVIARRQ